MKNLWILRIKDGGFYKKNEEKVEVDPIGLPYIISYCPDDDPGQNEINMIKAIARDIAWGKLPKNAYMYTHGQTLYSPYCNGERLPDYGNVPVQGYIEK